MVYGALDIGGTKIAGALVDAGGRVVARAQRPTPARGSAEAMMAAVTSVVDELAARPEWASLSCLGIGSAGPVDTFAGTVSPVNIPAWRSFPLVERVRSHPAVPAGIEPVLVGDAVAMAAAEHWIGAAKDAANVLCMVVSTGVGGGLVLGGSVHAGTTGNAGHIGHITVDQNGPVCPCGARGCVERYASGTAIAAHALESGWTPPAGLPVTAREVAASARAGDAKALAAFDRAGRALAAAIAATAALVELDLVVVGGGVSQAGEVLFAPLRHHLKSYAVLDFTRDLRVVSAGLALDAGLIGAAATGVAASGLSRAGGSTRGRTAP
ncbi:MULTISPECIES: ROK family protein [unclassified Streptomyces]|uniref:ROK family protein n=1 Tax=unclassified Streptomyces TaxID=2593676 RepID=UPI0006FC4E94|nr:MULTISPECIES: ROK family protein [unclassified Streptomyces]KQX48055.1 ROK family transcriptional regulator [Streptomyces sp. Root1304]KRA82447.1 ROK family transcriptional regulator [Streptomyces sp. Root66D1]